jgi:hypothetical protein
MPFNLPTHNPSRRLRRAVAAFVLAAACATAMAQTPAAPAPSGAATPPPSGTPAPHPHRSRQPFNAPGPEQVARRVETMDDQVKLTPDQATKVKAAYQKEADRMIAINTKYAGKDTAPEQRRAKAGEMLAVTQDTQAALGTILTPQQSKQWADFVRERKEKNRSTFRRNRGQHTTPATGAPASSAPAGTAPAGTPPTKAPPTSGTPK